MSPLEAARKINCCPTYIRYLIRKGILKAKKHSVGKSYTGKEMFMYDITPFDLKSFQNREIKSRGIKRGSKLKAGIPVKKKSKKVT